MNRSIAQPIGNERQGVWSEPVAVCLLAMLAFVAWTIKAGPDVHWDFLNYHLYLGIHADGARLSRDYFPAGTASYLTPYAYWPIGAMVAAKWPAMLVGSVLAMLHSFAALVSWYLAAHLFPEQTRNARILRIVATIVAVAGPVVMMEAGTSFIDITTAIPVVLGLALFLRAINMRGRVALALFVAGSCFGAAVALKLTNGVYAVAAFAAAVFLVGLSRKVSWKVPLIFGLGEAGGFLLTYAVYGYQLWREFGNPFFPFFDSYFAPAAAKTGASAVAAAPSIGFLDWLLSLRSMVHQRFLPMTAEEWLLRPLYMLDPVPNVYVEVAAPDARFLALFCIAPFALWRIRARLRDSNLVGVLLFFAFAWIIWLAMFGNGRYLMPLALIVGPALVACAAVVWPRPDVVGVVAIFIFAAVQVAGLWMGSSYRWTLAKWQKYWFSASVPAEITERPATFVSLDTKSISWMTMYMHPDSRIVSLGIRDPASEAGSGVSRVSRILSRSRDIVAVFEYSAIDVATGLPFPPSPVHAGPTALQNNLKVDFDSCRTGVLDLDSITKITVEVDKKIVERKLVQGFFFCKAVYEPGSSQAVQIDSKHEGVFNLIEDRCEPVFEPKRTPTQCDTTMCYRKYFATDRVIGIKPEGQILHMHFRAAESPLIGMVDEVMRDPSRINCHKNLGRYIPWSPGTTLFSRE